MKNPFRLPFTLAFSLLMIIFLLISCDTGGDGLKENLEDPAPIANGVAIFGYRTEISHYFTQHVSSQLGTELVSGDWSSAHCWSPLTRVTVGGAQYIVGHGVDCYNWVENMWFIQRINTTGDLLSETDSGTWHYFYATLVGFQVGDRAFIFGQKIYDDHRWFIQEILPGGKLAANESDSGYWHYPYENIVPLYVGGKTYLYGQNEHDNYWFINRVDGNGKMFDKDSGYWEHYWPTNVSYSAGGDTYLFGHRKTWSGKGPWFIQKINADGSIGPQTDSGEWHNYYATMASYQLDDKAYLFGHNTNKHWFIQEVYANGLMGGETSNGNWQNYYEFILPFAFDTEYLHSDDWMGSLSSIIGDRKLARITLPGSHDTGMNKNDKHDCFFASSCNTVTQTGDVLEQLNRGARYFDIRPVIPDRTDPLTWCTGHQQVVKHFGIVGCNGECKPSIIGALVKFFSDTNHKNELVILKVSHCKTFDGGENNFECSEDQMNAYARDLAGQLSDYLVTCEDCNLLDMTLNEILEKGNIILVFTGVDRDRAAGIFNWGYGAGCDYYLVDKYSDTEDFWHMRNNQVDMLLDPSNHANDKLFLLSWTLTLSTTDALDCPLTGMNILDLANKANPKLFVQLYDLANSGKITETLFPNVLYTDNYDHFATRTAIYLNRFDGRFPLWATGTEGNPGAYYKMQPDGNFVVYGRGPVLWATNTDGHSGAYYRMQTDGNFVVYGPEVALWATGTDGNPGAYYAMQDDGNFVIYSASDEALWSSETDGNPGATLNLQDDGNLVIYSASGDAIWSSGTSGHPGAHFVMQSDGNFVIYGPREALWASGTAGNPGAYYKMQDDGNFVIYSASDEILWSSGTEGHPGAYYTMQDDGNFVIYGADVALWAAGTDGNPGAYYKMQSDGNFVIYSASGEVLWASGTDGHPGAYFIMQDDGNFVVYSKSWD